jgi:hypothetical protein
LRVQTPRYRVITDTREIARLLRSTYETILNIEDFNIMATISNLGMIGEDLTDLNQTAIANVVNRAGSLLFAHKGIDPIDAGRRQDVLHALAQAIIMTEAINPIQ